MLKMKNMIKHYKTSFNISWNSSKLFFIFRIIFELVSVLTPLITLYYTSQVINILDSDKNPINKQNEFVYALLFLVGIQVLAIIIGRINTLISSFHEQLVSNYIQLEIVNKINTLDISYFDNLIFYNEIHNANTDSQSLQSLTWSILSIIKGSVQFITSVLIINTLNAYFSMLLVGLYIPAYFIDKYIARKRYEWQRNNALNQRQISYVKGILQSKDYAKDIRVFDVQDYFINKFQNLWHKWYNDWTIIQRKRIILSFVSSILPYFGMAIISIYLGIRIIKNELTIGDFTYYSGIVVQLIGAIGIIMGTVNRNIESEMRLTKYAEFLKWKPNYIPIGTETIYDVNHIEFKNVCFKYPGTEKTILNNISFIINKNENVAIVGLNGAGKSTIVKLLLRLYKPDNGNIYINGIDVEKIDIKNYHKYIGVVFQDFVRYNLKLRETIALTDLENSNDDLCIKNAIENAGLEINETQFKDGLNTYLGRQFDEEGVELSGGQWQKLAIAQAYFKDPKIMIMDEPNSSLDPEAELMLFDKMKQLCINRCAIFVTHRLSAATSATRIIVVDKGICVEQGSHSELIRKDGLYADLFKKQSKNYLEKSK